MKTVLQTLHIAPIIGLLILTIGCGENKQQLTQRLEAARQTAMKYRDVPAATTLMCQLADLNPTGTNYKDSLMNYYYKAERFVSAQAAATEVLGNNAKDTTALYIAATSSSMIGDFKTAIGHYQNLHSISPKWEYLYQQAGMYFNMRNSDSTARRACTNLIGKILAEKGIDDKRVTIYTDVPYVTSITAASWNMKGFLHLDSIQQTKTVKHALESFEKAIEIDPKFTLARNNLEYVKQQAKKR